MRLISRPMPVDGQSVESYIRTLAIRNGYSSPAELLTCAFDGHVKGPLRNISSDLIKELTGHTCSTHRGLQLMKSSDLKGYRYYHLVLPEHHLRRDEHYCPDCYQQTPVVLARWNIAWLPMCLKHKTVLQKFESGGKAASLKRAGVQTLHLGPAANDELYDEAAYKAQAQLESELDRQIALRTSCNNSMVKLIDDALIRCLNLNHHKDLKGLKRRYPARFFPLNHRDTFRMLEMMYFQKMAA